MSVLCPGLYVIRVICCHIPRFGLALKSYSRTADVFNNIANQTTASFSVNFFINISYAQRRHVNYQIVDLDFDLLSRHADKGQLCFYGAYFCYMCV